MNRKEEIQKHIKALLQLIGDNSEREGLKGTPERVARMFGRFTEVMTLHRNRRLPHSKMELMVLCMIVWL